MTLRPSLCAVGLVLLLLTAFAMMLGKAITADAALKADLTQARMLSTQLGLSDLALFTEARYTRHPSMADLHTPFQDHPVSLDHFPSGSFIAPRPVGGHP